MCLYFQDLRERTVALVSITLLRSASVTLSLLHSRRPGFLLLTGDGEAVLGTEAVSAFLPVNLP